MGILYKNIIIVIFFAYYIVAFLLYIPWLNEHLEPLKLFNAYKIVKVNKNIYLGVYPTKKDLIELKNKKGIKRVITLLNPDMPIIREFVKEERKNCKELGLELIIIPISYFSKNIMNYVVLKNFSENNIKTYIHAYYFDKRMKIAKRILERSR